MPAARTIIAVRGSALLLAGCGNGDGEAVRLHHGGGGGFLREFSAASKWANGKRSARWRAVVRADRDAGHGDAAAAAGVRAGGGRGGLAARARRTAGSALHDVAADAAGAAIAGPADDAATVLSPSGGGTKTGAEVSWATTVSAYPVRAVGRWWPTPIETAVTITSTARWWVHVPAKGSGGKVAILGGFSQKRGSAVRHGAG